MKTKVMVLPMSGLSKCMLLAAAAVLAPGAASAQVRPARPVAQPPGTAPRTGPAATQPGAPVPGNPDYKPPQPSDQLAPLPLPPAVWSTRDAQDLLATIGQIGAEGLDPADYDPAGLAAAISAGDPILLSKAATDRFDRVSWDLAMGHVRRAVRVDWYVTDNDIDAEKQDALMRSALATHQIGDALRSLLPTHPQYAALKAALASTPATDTAKLARIRLNMDRWRWLPRDLGQKYIIVNVPSFYATLVENGVNRWKNRAVAGKLSTPTPQLSATAVGVILNPWWEVPKSIEHEAAGKKGFVPVKAPDGSVQRWRQPPGPTNALGQIKFVMPNSQAIYLHDTNARSRFNSDVRALSHGCIRTMKIMDLATQLLGDDGGEWTPDKIQETLATKKTVQANFVKPVPVYIVYFSSAALLDGTIVNYQDLYGRDAKAMTALEMKDGGASLVPPKATKPPVPATDQVAAR
ncbi:L,D-transpeptidase family protein [Sphingomonas sp.]|uniref:L,D-transpeptidase family protein n=1 Tax=Sphingomonas sp. TaxID=28214 RepID=UPI0025D00152|nr:L,D-transpeptidase family protein [Sphingomonas sp.]MBV9528059.1 L,D-transpeptidase family protein [Sphingomonas sp.]